MIGQVVTVWVSEYGRLKANTPKGSWLTNIYKDVKRLPREDWKDYGEDADSLAQLYAEKMFGRGKATRITSSKGVRHTPPIPDREGTTTIYYDDTYFWVYLIS